MKRVFELSSFFMYLFLPRLTLFLLICLFATYISCSSDELMNQNNRFEISGHELLDNGEARTFKGVNTLQTFGLTDTEKLTNWNVQIVREFIGNLREQPIFGEPIQTEDGTWLHSLQRIVEQNRTLGLITILCPFGWTTEEGDHTLLTGLNPREQSFFPSYINQLSKIATHFAGEEDVWIELWNEPYHWNNENNYSHDLWFSDMQFMIRKLRENKEFTNIIVVPVCEQGQSEEVLFQKGKQLLNEHNQILFDIHAYEKWLTNSATISSRMNSLRDHNFPIIFGELGVKNIGSLMYTEEFLLWANTYEVNVIAWLWKYDSQDQNALLTEEGEPNNQNNRNWGSNFYHFLTND